MKKVRFLERIFNVSKLIQLVLSVSGISNQWGV